MSFRSPFGIRGTCEISKILKEQESEFCSNPNIIKTFNDSKRSAIVQRKHLRKPSRMMGKPRRMNKARSTEHLQISTNFDASKYTNFKDAYLALNNQLNRTMFNQKTTRKPTPEFFTRLYQEKLGNISPHVKEDSIYKIIKDDRELTFHPKVMNPFGYKRRSVQEFVKDMVLSLESFRY